MPTLVFWIDVDNTLLNNDEVKEKLDQTLRGEVGDALAERFWTIYEQVRIEQSVVDIPLSLTRLRERTSLTEMDEATYRHVHSIFDNFPFYTELYPYALETLHYLRTIGLPVIVSDGDLQFQAEKIFNSGIAEAVEGRILLYVHKQQHLDELQQRYPADHYVCIDDKPDILTDVKTLLHEKITTVFVKQGKYAAGNKPDYFAPDISIDHIGDLRSLSQSGFLLKR